MASPSSVVGAPSSTAAIQWQCKSTKPRTALLVSRRAPGRICIRPSTEENRNDRFGLGNERGDLDAFVVGVKACSAWSERIDARNAERRERVRVGTSAHQRGFDRAEARRPGAGGVLLVKNDGLRGTRERQPR